MPYREVIQLDYRAVVGLRRRLERELGVKIDKGELRDFISFSLSLTFSNIEWYGRVRRIELKDLWKAFQRDLGSKSYDQTKAPNTDEAQHKQIS